MEKKTIVKLAISAVVVVLAVAFACGLGRGGQMNYQLPGPYTAEASNDFSTVQVAMTVQEGQITECAITSSGDSDLLNDGTRAEWAQSIVDNQSYENDVISSATLKYSAASVKEASADIFNQAGLPIPEPAATPEPEPEPEPEPAAEPAESAEGVTDGTYAVDKTTDFSTIRTEITVEGGKVVSANITSEGANDLLTDEIRDAWEAQIVEKQSIDAVSGVTISSNTVQEAIGQLLPFGVEGGSAESAGLTDGTYTVQKTTDFSTIDVEMTVENGAVASAKITSEGANDLLTDEHRNAWAQQIVEKQSVDTVSGVTISSNAVSEAVDELMAQAAGGSEAEADPKVAELEAALAEAEARAQEAEAKAAEAEAKAAEAEAKAAELEAAAAATVAVAVEETKAAEEPAEESMGLTDGTYAVRKTTDFSTIDVAITVLGGNLTQAEVYSQGASDLLTDEIRDNWEAQILEKQGVDAVSGVTISSNAVAEAVAELMAEAAPAAESAEAEPEAEAKATAGPADPSKFMRAKPVIQVIAPVEPEAAEEPKAESMGLTDGTYAVRKTTDFSDIDVALTVLGGNVTQAVVYSQGASDLLTDEYRDAWAKQIVEKQAVDAVSGVTVSSNAVSEAVAELMERATPSGETAEAEPEAEAKATAGPADPAKFMRAKPVIQVIAPAEPEAETETTEVDASKFMRAKPVIQVIAPAEPEAEAAEVDASRFMRPRPASAAEPAEAEAEPAAVEPAALTEEERLAAILPYMVTTMGENRENSYVIDYLEQDPYLVSIYEGYGFAKDYGSARGHEYTLEDVAKTQRPHPKANCLTCKTPDMHKMIEEQGVAVYSMPFDEVMAQMTNNISCYTCHGDDMGNGGKLVVTHQYVNEALGENVSTINAATLSCGQCHIEYYFTPSDSEAMMPYHSVEEMTPEAILAYYDEMGFSDWTQESTGTPLLKAQHPEMETYLQGKHAAFLSCADCHMPTETTEDGLTYKSHYLASPLENEALLESCAQCHGDTDMVSFVRGIQESTTARETAVGNRLANMKETLAAAVASGEWSEDDLNAVRKLHREAQWFFDYCYVENAEGAHNTALATRCLDTAEAKIDEAMALLSKAA